MTITAPFSGQLDVVRCVIGHGGMTSGNYWNNSSSSGLKLMSRPSYSPDLNSCFLSFFRY